MPRVAIAEKYVPSIETTVRELWILVTSEDENFFLVEVCVKLYTSCQGVPRASVDLCSFVAGFAVDIEKRGVSTERACGDCAFLLMDADLIVDIDMGAAATFYLVV